MRRYLLVVPFLIACGGSEMPPADSVAAAPAALTDADIAGTWTGTLMPEGSDSVLAHWTQTCGAGTCRLTIQEQPNDTITSTYMIEADSIRGTTTAYADTNVVKGAMVMDTWVARVSSGQVTGSGLVKLADQPDSVVMRYRFTGTRQP